MRITLSRKIIAVALMIMVGVTMGFVCTDNKVQAAPVKKITKVVVSPKNFDYNRQVHKPKITVYCGNKKLSSKYYTISGTPKTKKPGEHRVKAKGRNGYIGLKSTVWNVKTSGAYNIRVKRSNGKLKIYANMPYCEKVSCTVTQYAEMQTVKRIQCGERSKNFKKGDSVTFTTPQKVGKGTYRICVATTCPGHIRYEYKKIRIR